MRRGNYSGAGIGKDERLAPEYSLQGQQDRLILLARR
jgi:hypothetical protein